MYEVLILLVYAIAAVVILAATAAVILAGLALGFAAKFFQEFGKDEQEGDA